MGGGALNYAYLKLDQIVHYLDEGIDADDRPLCVEAPLTQELVDRFKGHLARVADVLRKVEWYWSGDSNARDAYEAITSLLGQTEAGKPCSST